MPVDEFHLRNTARELADLYRQLNGLKHTHPTPPEVRVMKPAPGPQTPGNWLWVNRYVEMEQNLRELCLNAFGIDGIGIHIDESDFTAPRLCRLIAWHAQPLSELDWAADLAQELEDQARTINRWTNPPETPRALIKKAQSSQQLLTAAHAAKAASAATGKHIDRKQVTYWGRAGHITTHKDSRGNTCYNLGEVINHINQNQ